MNNTNGTNGNGSKKRELTAQRIIEALHASHGLLTLAAKRAGVGYRTVCRYIQDYPSVAEAVVESKESMIDLAEAKLYEKIRQGDNTAIIFYLKTQAKTRGYVERQEVTGEVGQPIKYEISVKDERAKELTERLIAGGAVVSNINLS